MHLFILYEFKMFKHKIKIINNYYDFYLDNNRFVSLNFLMIMN